MENQHRKITGYRELTEGEIALMNKIKAAGAQLDELANAVRLHVATQITMGDTDKERGRIHDAEPMRWVAIGRTDLQTGLMALTRAVAQPGSF